MSHLFIFRTNDVESTARLDAVGRNRLLDETSVVRALRPSVYAVDVIGVWRWSRAYTERKEAIIALVQCNIVGFRQRQINANLVSEHYHSGVDSEVSLVVDAAIIFRLRQKSKLCHSAGVC